MPMEVEANIKSKAAYILGGTNLYRAIHKK